MTALSYLSRGHISRQPSRGGSVFVSHHIYLHSVASEHYNNLGGESITGDRESKSQQYEFTSQQSTATSMSFPRKTRCTRNNLFVRKKQSIITLKCVVNCYIKKGAIV